MDIEQHPLWQTQLDLEARMISEGVDSFRAAVIKRTTKGDGAAVGGARKVVSDLIGPMSKAIVAFFALVNTPGRSGSRHSAVRLIGDIDPDTLAFISVKKALGLMLTRNRKGLCTLQRVAEAIGDAVAAEAMIEQFARHDPAKVSAVLRRLNRLTSHISHRRRVLVHAMRSVEFVPDRWSLEQKRTVGIKLLDIMIESTGLFEVHPASFNSPYRVSLSDQALTAISDRNEVAELLKPRFLPCVVPPKPWTASGKDGGYWSALTVEPSRLVKYNFRNTKKPLNKSISDTVLAAVNNMQDTAWKVNHRVLDVLRYVVEGELDDLDVLPRIKLAEIPEKPHDIQTNGPARKEYRHAAAKAYEDRAVNRSRRLQVIKTLGVAEEFGKFDSIYFPHEVDFRGRVYAVPQWLNPQGPDYAKGLLTFANGKPIGNEQGPGWLAIHGANCFGVDKVTLEERIDWVEQNSERIRSVAQEPMSNLWWAEADGPWQFLAFAFEWDSYCAAVDAGRGEDFVSHLPVMVDGTCNGIQHYSAMLRDAVGGAATNLVPAAKPADIYGVVAAKVMGRLDRGRTLASTSGAERMMADHWYNFGIDRKITKRPVMVLPYGGTFTSCREYVEAAVRERGALPFDTTPIQLPDGRSSSQEKEAILFLAHVVWDSIGEVVIAARVGMKWLQEAAKASSMAGVNVLRWTTPSGFEVAQSYTEMKAKVVSTAFNGKTRIQMKFDYPTDNLNKRRQGTAIAPNFVHSMDAAALHRTIETAVANGVNSFAMIHDSFGTVASDLPMMAACLRTEFVQMYTDHDVLQEFADNIRSQTGDAAIELPELPPRGTLDLSAVLQSDFFFA